MLKIVDYRMGNLASIVNMLKTVDVDAQITSDPTEIRKADKLILPGVGAFDNGMKNIAELGLLAVLNECVLERKIPVLGLCLGMQLLTRSSEEGSLPGLGWIEGQTVKFHFDPKATGLRIPQMGWNDVTWKREDSLMEGLADEASFYFVHSYHLICENESDVLGVTHHGYDFPSVIRRQNIMGTQFHPEKSHKFGRQLLKNFALMQHA